MICGGEELTYVDKTQVNFNWRFSLLFVTDKRKYSPGAVFIFLLIV